MEVFGLGLKIKEEGAATVEAAIKRLGAELAKTALTVGGLGVAFNKLITNTSEAQFASAQLEATIRATGGVAGQTAGALQEQASALQRVTSYGDDAIIGMQSLLLSFTKIRGEVFTNAVPVILDLATALRMDLASAAMMVGKALNDPANGLDALGRKGIKFSEAQKQVIADLVKTGEVAQAQTAILTALQGSFAGSAEAARNTLGGALQALNEAFNDLFEITTENTSVVVAMINKLTSALLTVNNSMETVKGVAIALGGVLLGAFSGKIVLAINVLIGRIIAVQMANLAAAGAAGVNSTALVTLMTAANLTAAAFTRLWAAIGGPLGATIAAVVAGFAVLNTTLNKRQKAIEDADAADQERFEKEMARIKAERQAKEDAEKQRIENAKAAVEADRKRIASLIEYNGLLPVNARNLTQLQGIERTLQTELNSANISLERRIELMRQMQTLQPLLAETQTLAGQKSFKATQEKYGVATVPGIDLQAIAAQITPTDITAFIAKVVEQIREASRVASETIQETIATDISNALINGIMTGIEQAVAAGNIGAGFKAMTSMLLAGVGDAMIKFGMSTAAFAKFMKKIKDSLMTLNPEAGLAMSLALIGAGAALKGAARSMFGGQGGGAAFSTASFGGGGFGGGAGAMTLPTTQLIFGNTSATTAAGMQPRQSMNVTVIGPNDPSAQRAIQELMTKANSRGRIG